MHACMYVCTYVCMYARTYARTYVRTYVCMYVGLNKCRHRFEVLLRYMIPFYLSGEAGAKTLVIIQAPTVPRPWLCTSASYPCKALFMNRMCNVWEAAQGKQQHVQEQGHKCNKDRLCCVECSLLGALPMLTRVHMQLACCGSRGTISGCLATAGSLASRHHLAFLTSPPPAWAFPKYVSSIALTGQTRALLPGGFQDFGAGPQPTPVGLLADLRLACASGGNGEP